MAGRCNPSMAPGGGGDQGRSSSETMTANDAELRAIKRVACGAFLVSLLLAGLKRLLADISGSLALMADSLDSATDSIASLMIWIGLALSARKTRMFPYGLYKVENFMSLILALLILAAGVQIAFRAWEAQEQLPQVTWPVLGGATLGVVVCSLLAWTVQTVGKRTGSPTLLAEARHRQADVLSSMVVVGALASNRLGFRVDRIATAVVLMFILHAGLQLFRDSMRVLLDAGLDPEAMKRIRTILESHPLVREVGFLAGRNAGRFRFVEAVLKLRTDDLKKAHRISDEIEQMIRREVPHVERVLIHAEPSSPERILVAVPLADMVGRISAHFGEAPFYAFLRVLASTGEVKQHEVLVNPAASVPKGKGVRVAEWLITRKTDQVCVRETLKGKGPGYALESAGVEVRLTDAEDLPGLIESLQIKA